MSSPAMNTVASIQHESITGIYLNGLNCVNELQKSDYSRLN